MKEEDFASERVLCLAGASGVGKTSVTAKLAAHYTRLGRKVAWVCADTVRAGAIAEAQACAGSLGVPLHLAYTPGDLAAAAAASQADLTLVDMPNCNPRREADIVAQGDLLAALTRRSIYLVTPATATDADLQQALAALGPFDLKGLIATKLDEGETVGSIFNAAWRSRLPLAYFTDGPRVLDDLQPAQAIKLVERLFKNR
jgi:flagellar biosynthesis protein FlhF